MTVRKRGLSRGLEALLKFDSAEVEKQVLKVHPFEPKTGKDPLLKIESDSEPLSPQALESAIDLQKNGQNTRESMSETQPPISMEHKASVGIEEVDTQSALVLALFEHIRKENLMLLEEAEALKRLIEEFELIIGRL